MPKDQPIFGVNDDDALEGTPGEGQAPAEVVEGSEQAPREGVPPALPSDPQAGQPETGEGTTQQGQPQRLYAGKFDSPDKLEQSYEELQRKLGQQGNALGTMQQQYQQLLQYMQTMQAQTPPRQQAGPAQQVDPSRFVEDLETRGPAVIEELVNNIVTQRWAQEGEVLGKGLQQVLQPLYSQYIQSQVRGAVQGQINATRAKYSDFEDYREDVKRIVGEQPQLLGTLTGVETAYLMAKAQRGNSPQTAAMQQLAQAQKRAAQMPTTTAGARQQQNQISPEDALKQAIFGTPNSQGVFG